jgi:hypothetical protein
MTDTKLASIVAAGDTLVNGRLLLQYIVNRHLARWSHFALVASDKADRLDLRANPNSLLGLAWLQLASAAAGKHRPRRCPRCGDWFLVDPRSRRGHDKYCSTRCRVAIHAKRTRARALSAGGASSRSIAKQLGVDGTVVRKWLAQQPRKKGK